MVLNDSQVLTALAVLTLGWLGVLSFWLYRVARHYNRLVERTGKTNLRAILEGLLGEQKAVEEHLTRIDQELGELARRGRLHIQKVGLIRFNPFAETGGNQSFALAVLDAEDNGLVMLSLHGREGTRMYVKPVKGGKSKYELSVEEKQAIAQATAKKLVS